MKIYTYIALLFFMSGVSGCSLFKPVSRLAAIAPVVCPPASQQQWALSWKAEQSRLMIVTQCEETIAGGRWQWFLLNQLGQRVATAQSRQGQVDIEYLSGHPASDLVPQLVEAWQLLTFELATLKAQSSDAWSFSEQLGQREIRFSGILRAEINYPTGNDDSGPITYTADTFSVVILSEVL